MKHFMLFVIIACIIFLAPSCNKPVSLETAVDDSASSLAEQPSSETDSHAPQQDEQSASPMPLQDKQVVENPPSSDILELTWAIVTPNAEFRITNDQSLSFDVDCDGDGRFEQTSLTDHYTCVFPTPGTYHTTIKGPLAEHLIQSPKTAAPNPNGTTLETRFPAPNGYYRLTQTDPAYARYLHSIPMLPEGSPVLLFNGAPKDFQDGHVAVLDIDVGKRDLQQCADAAMRLRTEYLFASNQHDKMVYHFANGLKFSWPQWKTGSRLVKNDKGKLVMSKTTSENSTYNNYRKWLDNLMMYANVDSLMRESKPLSLDELSPGDVFASRGSSYNHLIIAIDVVTSPNGDKQFLLAQSYMPAQQIEVLKNPYNADTPWYSLEDVKKVYQSGAEFMTPEWAFPAPGSNLFRMP